MMEDVERQAEEERKFWGELGNGGGREKGEDNMRRGEEKRDRRRKRKTKNMNF